MVTAIAFGATITFSFPFVAVLVPAVLLSGNHAAIARWRRKQSLGATWLRRPDLLARLKLNKLDRQLLIEFMDEHKPKISVD